MLPSLISKSFPLALSTYSHLLCATVYWQLSFYSQQVFQRSQVEAPSPTAHPVLLVLLVLLLFAELPKAKSFVLFIFVERVQALGVVVD